jgi:hypothetical protein
MSKVDGFFELRTPRDLLDKLEVDFDRFQSCPAISREAQYAAFDFFVTAEHLPEWLAVATSGDKAKLRGYAEGLLVSDVANGAKHFRVDPKRHNVVRQTEVHSGAFQGDTFQNDTFDVHRLVIEREDGHVEAVVDVATRVLQYWKNQVA